MTQMPTQPRSPSDHYQSAERLIAAAPETPESAGLLALAVLALAPRRARRVERHTPPPTGGSSPSQRWLFGTDDTEGDGR
jgi:MYXO-CTERM domain-containing protein